MPQPTVFEFEPEPDPTELTPKDWEPVEHPEPVLLFRPSERRWATVPRRLGGSVAAVASWVPELRGALPAVEPSADEGRVVAGLTWLVAAVCMAVWAVVGAVFWLPVLVRAVGRFALLHLQAMLEGGSPDGRGLREAVTFYGRGFVSALDVARRRDGGVPVGFGRREPLGLSRMAPAGAWAAVCWYVVLMGLGQASPPPELAASFLDGPWQAWSAGALDRVGLALQEIAGAAARASDVVGIQR